MKYTAVSVRQLDRKGKPWQARAKYKDVYGKWKEVSKMLPDAKGKKEANKMAKEWLEQLNAEADLMPNAGKAKNKRTQRKNKNTPAPTVMILEIYEKNLYN